MVHVEFYGTVRLKSECESIDVEATSLAEAFAQLSKKLPQLNENCFDNGRLRGGYLANLNGTTFTTDPATILQSGDSLIILSADVGG